MRGFVYLALMFAVLASSCAKRATLPTTQKPESGRFSVDPDFVGGDSVLIAARRVLPDCDYISLTRPMIGSDALYEYAMFFVGRDIHVGFEGIYYRYFIFAKVKTAPDWSAARVFDWPGDYLDPFTGPIERLEKEGRELGKEPNKALEGTRMLGTPAADAPVAPSTRVPHL